MLKPAGELDINRIYDSFWNRDESFYTWGNDDLDRALPLAGRGQLIVLAGAQGSGKSTWSVEMAIRNAKAGLNVAYLALEVPLENIIKRTIERQLGITKEDRRIGAIFDLENIEQKRERSMEILKDYAASGLKFLPENTTPDFNPYHIKSIYDYCTGANGPNLLFIDNLAEIESDERDEYSKADQILRTLSDIRSETGMTIVLLHHLAKPKIGEPLSINSIKGNNITITKADVAVAMDKCHVPNFNWRCHWKDDEGKIVEKAMLKKFYSYAPKIQVRAIHSFKDRYYSIEGLCGYMRLNDDGEVEFLTVEQMREMYPLNKTDKEKLQLAYDKFKLLPPPSAIHFPIKSEAVL